MGPLLRWTRVLTLVLLSVLFFADVGVAQVRVRGYYRKDGTYVRPHVRSSPDGNPYNNWSFPGNVNPYTGEVAAGDPATYLRNYYNRSGRTWAVPSTTSLSPSTPLATVDLDALGGMRRLPGEIADQEVQRAVRYCSYIFGGDVRSRQGCEARQAGVLARLMIPDYSTLPQTEVARGARYCEYIFGDDRASFYHCLNRQIFGIAGGDPEFGNASNEDEARARAYCQYIFGDDRSGFFNCLRRQSRGISEGIPTGTPNGVNPAEWNRARQYCEYIFGNDRAGAASCYDRQANGLRGTAATRPSTVPPAEWDRAVGYCEYIFGNDRAGAASCRYRQAQGLRSHYRPGARGTTAARECEYIFGNDRAGFWNCVAQKN